MDIHVLYDYCLQKKGSQEGFPFDEDTLAFKVEGKIFALINLKKWEQGMQAINLKCDPDRAIALRDVYAEITPGYHMSKKHWNTIAMSNQVTWQLVTEWIDHSYDLVVAGLPRRTREALEE